MRSPRSLWSLAMTNW